VYYWIVWSCSISSVCAVLVQSTNFQVWLHNTCSWTWQQKRVVTLSLPAFPLRRTFSSLLFLFLPHRETTMEPAPATSSFFSTQASPSFFRTQAPPALLSRPAIAQLAPPCSMDPLDAGAAGGFGGSAIWSASLRRRSPSLTQEDAVTTTSSPLPSARGRRGRARRPRVL
jgi:hypothetical protein